MKGARSKMRKKGNERENRASESDRQRTGVREEIAVASPAGLAVGHRDRLRFPIPSSLQAATQPRSATL